MVPLQQEDQPGLMTWAALHIRLQEQAGKASYGLGRDSRNAHSRLVYSFLIWFRLNSELRKQRAQKM